MEALQLSTEVVVAHRRRIESISTSNRYCSPISLNPNSFACHWHDHSKLQMDLVAILEMQSSNKKLFMDQTESCKGSSALTNM